MAYTNIDDPSAHFQTALWTGTNAKDKVITNDGNSDLQPDWIWAKSRTSTSYTDNHFSVDSSRGRLKGLVQNDTSAETTTTGNATQQAERDLQSFDTDGFTVGIVNSTAALNASSASHVAWQWKANGGTTASNSDGSVTSTVQANTDAGFSIVTYTGTGSAATVGHGLGVAPKVVIVKARTGVPTSWAVFHKDGSTSDDDTFVLNSEAAKATYAGFWNNQYPSSSVFGISNDIWLNGNTENFVAYCFAEKQGFSKFGKYVGNGSTDGTFVYTGFKPAWIMVKNIDSGVDHWHIIDNKRNPNNVAGKLLFADLTSAEITYTTEVLFDILSNGFKLRGDYDHINKSGETIIYMAFAENPFVTSTGIPTTAR
jgi:hypothetical protein